MLSEAVLLSKLNHPNIIRTFNADVLELNGQHFGFFTMEYVAGAVSINSGARLVSDLFPLKLWSIF